MATILITGCDRGIGEELALQYAAVGDRVIATCRDPDVFSKKHGTNANIEVHGLDVTDERAVSQLAAALDDVAIDILINNAGIPGPHPPASKTDLTLWRAMLEVNLIAPFVVSTAFIEHVARSDRKVIAFISSRMGSIGLNNSGHSYGYRSSKAGVNMVMKTFAIDLAPRAVCVLGIHPGNVMVAGDRGLTLCKSVAGIRKVIDHCGPHQTGTLYDYSGQILPW